MHIVMLVLVGLALLALFYGAARLLGRRLRNLLPAYFATWFVASLINAWIGVTRAGYSVAEEMLVFIPIFGLPVLAALVLARDVK